MSDDRFEQEEPKDEDVEAHKKLRKANDETETSDDVEAHHHKRKALDEPGSDELLANDESDDVEAHVKRR
jgi:hypothetical protein